MGNPYNCAELQALYELMGNQSGVDIKQVDGKAYVIEVNYNPNVDAGVEDAVLKEELYLRIMRVFRRRIDERRNSRSYW